MIAKYVVQIRLQTADSDILNDALFNLLISADRYESLITIVAREI